MAGHHEKSLRRWHVGMDTHTHTRMHTTHCTHQNALDHIRPVHAKLQARHAPNGVAGQIHAVLGLDHLLDKSWGNEETGMRDMEIMVIMTMMWKDAAVIRFFIMQPPDPYARTEELPGPGLKVEEGIWLRPGIWLFGISIPEEIDRVGAVRLPQHRQVLAPVVLDR